MNHIRSLVSETENVSETLYLYFLIEAFCWIYVLHSFIHGHSGSKTISYKIVQLGFGFYCILTCIELFSFSFSIKTHTCFKEFTYVYLTNSKLSLFLPKYNFLKCCGESMIFLRCTKGSNESTR